MDYEEKKHGYDTLLLQLESSMSRLEQDVKKSQEEIVTKEAAFHRLTQENILLDLYEHRAKDELKIYVSQKSESEGKKRSVREVLLKQIAEQEKRGKHLKEDQKKVKDNLGNSSKQVELWGNMERLFECKRKSMINAGDLEDTVIHREPGTETLVL